MAYRVHFLKLYISLFILYYLFEKIYHIETPETRNIICSNKQGDSKSDVLLCFDTKFKS